MERDDRFRWPRSTPRSMQDVGTMVWSRRGGTVHQIRFLAERGAGEGSGEGPRRGLVDRAAPVEANPTEVAKVWGAITLRGIAASN